MSAPFSSYPFDGLGIDRFAEPLFITANRAPTSNDLQNPGTRWQDRSSVAKTIYQTTGAGVWESGGNADATTSSFGIVQLATLTELQNGNAPAGAYVPTSNDVATVINAIVVGAVPPATELQAGIAEIATQVETDAGTDDTRIVTPLKLATFVASGGFPATFTDLTATGTVSFTGATGGITMTSATASSLGTTGAGIDLTLASSGGRVVVNGEEAAADAVRILSAAGGLDVDVALQMSLVSSQNAATAIVINASAGGIDITAAGAATEDIDIVNTAGSVNITAGESATDSIVISSTIGGIQINAAGAGAGEDIAVTATGSSIRLVSTENVTDSIVLSSTNGGIQILTPGAAPGEDIELTATGSSVHITATENATDAINIDATVGGINILASGATAGEDINITATGSSVNLSSTENAALAIVLNTNGGTSETIRARNQQGTGAGSIELLSTAGGITFTAGLGTADAINLAASTAGGGIDIDSSTGGVIVDTTGAISLDAAAASNLTVTGAFALDLISTLGKVTLSSGQSAVDSVVITSLIGGIDILAAGAAAGEDIDIIATGSSVNISATEDIATAITIIATAGGIDISASGAAAGEDIDIVATGSSVNIQATESDINAITINASGAAGGVNMDAGSSGVIVDTTGAISLDSAAASNFTVTGAFDLSLISSAGSVNVTAGEVAADSMVLTNNGMDIVITGAATRDFDLTNTGGSVNITATENVTDAIVINASGAASALQLDAGTGSIRFGTGLVVPVTTVVFGASPYTVLGTDYFISVDTSGGAVTVTLPAATALTGRTFVIRDTGGAAAISNITIGGGGTNLVGGGAAAATKVLSAAYAGATVYSNGATWNYALVV